MAIELRVVSGARTGFREIFDGPQIAIGRHPGSDLQLDPNEDLDVSTRHAEIRGTEGRWLLRDLGSTNGTFVNGRRIGDVHELRHGDVIRLGVEGPSVEVSIPGAAAAAGVPGTVVRASQARPSTGERVRVAVKHETKGLRVLVSAGAVLLVGGVALAYWLGQRTSHAELAQLTRLVAANESSATRLRTQLAAVGDTSLLNALQREQESISARVQRAGPKSSEEIDSLRRELQHRTAVQQGLAAMDVPAISARNDGAVAFLVSELDGRPYGGTAFGVEPNGLLATNRHNVRTAAGHAATRLGVKFANSDNLRRAHVVAESADADLALVQVDEAGTYPAVAGIATDLSALRVGDPIVTIGFPLAMDTPMEGDSAKTSLTAGTVSKLLPTVLQIDAFANHGSSGSPVFSRDGRVVGVVYGGPAGGAGRIVFAVPGPALVELLQRRR